MPDGVIALGREGNGSSGQAADSISVNLSPFLPLFSSVVDYLLFHAAPHPTMSLPDLSKD